MDKELKQYVKDRDKAILSFNIKKIRNFCEKYQHLYNQPIPKDDRVLMASSMKCVLVMTNATFEQKIHAMAWLCAHGFKPQFGGY